jgi:hypothetical protein
MQLWATDFHDPAKHIFRRMGRIAISKLHVYPSIFYVEQFGFHLTHFHEIFWVFFQNMSTNLSFIKIRQE